MVSLGTSNLNMYIVQTLCNRTSKMTKIVSTAGEHPSHYCYPTTYILRRHNYVQIWLEESVASGVNVSMWHCRPQRLPAAMNISDVCFKRWFLKGRAKAKLKHFMDMSVQSVP